MGADAHRAEGWRRRFAAEWFGAATWQQRTTLGLAAGGVLLCAYLMLELVGLDIRAPRLAPLQNTPTAMHASHRAHSPLASGGPAARPPVGALGRVGGRARADSVVPPGRRIPARPLHLSSPAKPSPPTDVSPSEPRAAPPRPVPSPGPTTVPTDPPAPPDVLPAVPQVTLPSATDVVPLSGVTPPSTPSLADAIPLGP